MTQGRRLVAGMGSGRLGGAGVGWWASWSHAAQGGRWVSPAKGLGSPVRLRLNLAGTGSVGRLGETTPRLGQI